MANNIVNNMVDTERICTSSAIKCTGKKCIGRNETVVRYHRLTHAARAAAAGARRETERKGQEKRRMQSKLHHHQGILQQQRLRWKEETLKMQRSFSMMQQRVVRKRANSASKQPVFKKERKEGNASEIMTEHWDLQRSASATSKPFLLDRGSRATTVAKETPSIVLRRRPFSTPARGTNHKPMDIKSMIVPSVIIKKSSTTKSVHEVEQDIDEMALSMSSVKLVPRQKSSHHRRPSIIVHSKPTGTKKKLKAKSAPRLPKLPQRIRRESVGLSPWQVDSPRSDEEDSTFCFETLSLDYP